MDKLFALGNSFTHTLWLLFVWCAVIILLAEVFKSFSRGDTHGAVKNFLKYGAGVAVIYFFPWLVNSMYMLPYFLDRFFGF